MAVWFIFTFIFILTASLLMLGKFGKGQPAVRFFGWFWLAVALLMCVVVYVFVYVVDWTTPVQ